MANRGRLLRSSLVAAMGGLLFGFDTAVICATAESAVALEQKKLCEVAAVGTLSDALLDQFFVYSETKAKSVIDAPPGFWDWYSGRDNDFRRELLLGLHPNYNPRVVAHLWELKQKYGPQFDRFEHLGLAMAFVYGQANEGSIRADWMDWVAAGRPVPSCAESFEYYIQHADAMLFPLDNLPLPLLLHIADNDVPITEREWVLQQYKGRSLRDLARIHYDLNYVKGDYARNYTDTKGAMALPAILTRGGVCSQQAYYASSIFKCLGVPSIRLVEPTRDVRRLHHAYEGCAQNDPAWRARFGGTEGSDGGYYLCPLTRLKRDRYEFAMLAEAMNNYEAYQRAAVARHIFLLQPQADKKSCLALLEQGVEQNPYCVPAWHTLADACRDGLLSPNEGWDICKRVRKQLPDYPELSCYVVNQIMAAVLPAASGHTDTLDTKTRSYLRGTIKWLRDIDRPYLAQDVLKISKLYAVAEKGTLGALKPQVTQTFAQADTCYVWQVLSDAAFSGSAHFRVRLKHAAAGAAGAFCLAAWADTDYDGIPDAKIGRSDLLQSDKDQWSSWEFVTEHDVVFVGFETKHKASFYYQVGGELEDYYGISDRVFYSRKSADPPVKSVRPRYANIQVELVTDPETKPSDSKDISNQENI